MFGLSDYAAIPLDELTTSEKNPLGAPPYLSIDFKAIERIKNGQEIDSNNKLIVTKRGLDIHWINPRGELERYFEQGVLPSGTLSRDEAIERRKSLEQSQKAIENNRVPSGPRVGGGTRGDAHAV